MEGHTQDNGNDSFVFNGNQGSANEWHYMETVATPLHQTDLTQPTQYMP